MEPNWPRLLEGYTFSVNDIHAGHGANGLTIYLPEAGASLVRLVVHSPSPDIRTPYHCSLA